ncbi:MAG: HD domain-containing phosphohydrolase [Bacteriovoracaceae bacterium]
MSTKTQVTKINELMNKMKTESATSLIDLTSLESQIKRYECVIELTQVIAHSIDYNKIHKAACSKVAELMECENVLIYQYNKVSNELFYELNGQEIKVPADDSNFAGACAQHRTNTLVKEAFKDARMKKEPSIHLKLQMKNLLLSPMMTGDEFMGVIVAVNKKGGSFHKDDVYFLQAAAGQMTIAIDNVRLFMAQEKQFLQICESMADAIGKKDKYTGGHTKRVAVFSDMIASEMELPFKELQELKLAAVLHDVGKIGIEDSILKKAAPLTDEEFAVMKDHPRLGYEILQHIESLKNVTDGMRYHHERPDGKGYPFGLKGSEIPVIAMIISVADTFDAMISTRPYRKGLPPMVAYEEIMKHSGTQFDDVVVEAFARAFRKTRMYKPEEDKFSSTIYKKVG